MRKKLIGISTTVLLLGLASFFNDIGSETLKAIMPMLITSLGGAGIAVGLIGGLKEGLDSLLRLPFGYYSDKVGKRKPFVVCGYVISSVAKAFMFLSTSWYYLLSLVAFDRFGKGVREAPRDAIIAESMPNKRGLGFGIHKALDNAGAIVGALLAFILFWLFGFSFKTILIISALIGFLSLFPLLFLAKEKVKSKLQSISFSKLSKELKLFLVISAVFALANFSYMFFILKAQTLVEGRWAIGLPLALYILLTITYAVGLIPFGKLSDRIGRKKVIFAGYFLFPLLCLGFTLFNSIIAFVVLFGLYGIFKAMIKGNELALVSDLAGNTKGTALGMFQMVIGFLAIISSILAGVFWNYFGDITFLIGGGIACIAIVLLLAFWRKINH